MLLLSKISFLFKLSVSRFSNKISVLLIMELSVSSLSVVSVVSDAFSLLLETFPEQQAISNSSFFSVMVVFVSVVFSYVFQKNLQHLFSQDQGVLL